MIYGNVLRSPEICYKCVAHSHIPSTSLSSLSLYRCLSRCQCHTHMKMFYKQFSSWFLCVFVHSFNYLAIKYDEPRSPSLPISCPLSCSRGVTRCRRLVVPIPALSALYGHVLWRPRVLVASLPPSTPDIGRLCAIKHIYAFIVSWQFRFLAHRGACQQVQWALETGNSEVRLVPLDSSV